MARVSSGYPAIIRQPRLRMKTRPTANTAATQTDSGGSVFSRKSKNSIASTRRPSVRCNGERDHDAEFGERDQRLARHRQKRVERLGAVERAGQREKVDAAEKSPARCRTGGGAWPRRSRAACARRASCGEHREHGARSPAPAAARQTSASATSSERPRQRVHSRRTLRRPIGAWIATATTNRPHRTTAKPDIAVGARENVGRGEPAAHGIKDGAEMDGHRERQHESGRPLRQEQERAHSAPRKPRRSTARFRPAIE